MSSGASGRRPYRSPRRRDAAAATRRAILDAARDLFTTKGYGATTIAGIASAAAVAAETVYAVFHNKRSILAALLDVAIAGDDEAVPVMERDWVRGLGDEPDVERRIDGLARAGAAILERRWAVDEIVRGAATSDPDIAALSAAARRDRREGQRRLLEIVARDEPLRSGLDSEAAVDVLFALGSPEIYGLLVGERGWSAAQFRAWYAEALRTLVFGLDAGRQRATPRARLARAP